MKTAPLQAAQPTRDAHGVPFSERYGDVYHPRAGALEQAHHVFLAGNRLPERWRRRERFVVLETGFGLGHNFLATWQAWRDDPQRCARLEFISIEAHPLRRNDLAAMHGGPRALADELLAQWPPLVHGLHGLRFDGGAVRLRLAFGDVSQCLPELVASVDAFYLDGFAPDRNPQMWRPALFKALARLAAPGATVATWTAARAVRDGLQAAGFDVQLAPGQGGKRDITLARYAPAFTPRRSPARGAAPVGEHHALIVGAGLAGCAAAWALAEQGWRCELVDRHDRLAAEASGNPGGIFHGVVHAEDGAHARWFRAAAFEAACAVRHAVDAGHANGSVAGLLQVDDRPGGLAAMRALLERLGLPPDLVDAVEAFGRPAWRHPVAGWVEPAGLARSFLRRAGASARWRPGLDVHALRRDGERWVLLDAAGTPLAAAANVVLAGGGGALRLLGETACWPLEVVRGQVSILSADDAAAAGLEGLALPMSGRGYALRLDDGRVLFGASSQAGDMDPAVRSADHAANLARLERLTGQRVHSTPDRLEGRTGWRWNARDRLPMIGPVPDLAAAAAAPRRLDQPRFVPRLAGLYLLTALGSRGIASATLGAQLLASWMSGAPCPVEASLLDAVDPARFVSRRARRAAAAR